MSKGFTFLSFVFGVIIGGIVTLLFAPKSGQETRDEIKGKMNDARDELSKNVEEWYELGKKRVNTLYEQGIEKAEDLIKQGKKALEDEVTKVTDKVKEAKSAKN